ncbi:GNAT family N-acetyltransferase [Histomonas meleagridis]|uniref:GNAT family N-acetyltransferase n=1 Tax=Histomonas meleagridis TaxID=135588 RepID=UPI00355A7ABD|nr:GNAT family N-acetyltransferase [Histomonas meleagridis]KAH0796172.1 GNAT family N-acetyltransferase [Histomonas meleagridis]
MSVVVRLAKKTDMSFVRDQITRLFASARGDNSFVIPNFEKEFNNCVDHPDQGPVFVAELNGKLVGVAACNIHRGLQAGGKVLQLDSLRTDDNVRSQGLGRALVKKVFEYSKENDVMTVELNEPPQRLPYYEERKRFYDRCGFDSAGTFRFATRDSFTRMI